MSGILDFFVSNYIWFLIISLILIFALIGYFVDTTQDKRFAEKVELDKELESRLAVAEATNMTLNQMVNKDLLSSKNNLEEKTNNEQIDSKNTDEKEMIKKDSSK